MHPKSRTLKEWNALGYRVQKGQRATSWTLNGVAKFDSEQVVKVVWPKKTTPTRKSYKYVGTSDEDAYDWDSFHHYEFDDIGDK